MAKIGGQAPLWLRSGGRQQVALSVYASITLSEAPPQTDEPVVSYDIPVNVIVDVHVYVHDHG